MARAVTRREELPLAILRLLADRPLSSDEFRHALTHTFDLQATRSAISIAVGALQHESLVGVGEVDGIGRFQLTGSGRAAMNARHDVHLPRRQAAIPATGEIAVLFTDVVGSTQLAEQLGPQLAHETMQAHFASLRQAISLHHGHEVKSLGDGLMVVFADPRTAVPCAVAMQQAVGACGEPITMRIGIDVGDPVRQSGDIFGRPVVVARRLCDLAEGGTVLMSEAVSALAVDHASDSLGPVSLKGLSEPVPAVVLRTTRPSRSPVIFRRQMAGA